MKNLNEMTDSRILFDKEPPAFGYMLILIVGVFMCATIGWSMRTPKIYTIHAQGTVTNENANYVMCIYTGEINSCDLSEGMLVEEGDVLFTVKSTDYNLQEKQLKLSLQTYEEKKTKYELLVQSIKDDKNYFDETNPDEELYYSIYEAYKAQVKQNILDTSTYVAYGYTDEQIAAEIDKNQGKISEIYYSTIQAAENAIAEAELQIASIEAQLVAISSGQKEYEVKATASGVLHLLGDYKKGMVVQTTTAIATITPENEGNVIEAYVSTADMARMHEGDSAQIVVDGLAQNVYGTITGAVKRIDSNVTTQETENGTTQMFKVLIAMDGDYLISQSGEKVDIKNGMTAVARITYDKVTYFNFMLEKLGFKTR